MKIAHTSVQVHATVELDGPDERFRVARRYGHDLAREVVIQSVRSAGLGTLYGSGRWTKVDGSPGDQVAERVRLDEQDLPIPVRRALAVARFAAVQGALPGLRADAERYRVGG